MKISPITICRGVATCPVLGSVITELAPMQWRLERLEAEREQLLEACATLSALNQALQNELHVLTSRMV
jgi:hypothetical protein